MDNSLYGKVFLKSDNNKKILVLETSIECLRIKQRNTYKPNNKFKFISYKEMSKHSGKNNYSILDNVKFYNICKL